MAEKKNFRVIGIDPGLASTGFGIIDCIGGKLELVGYGVIETKSDDEHSQRLLAIYERLNHVIKEFKPDYAEMEGLFFARNITSAMAVAEAKGVITLCLAKNGMEPAIYTPNQIKFSVTGSSKAEKDTVQQYVQILLKMDHIPKPDHAADALAGAITHINSLINSMNDNI